MSITYYRQELEMVQAARLRQCDPLAEAEEAALDSEYCLAEYRVELTGAKATMQNAKALIHTYCQSLPSDRLAVFKA